MKVELVYRVAPGPNVPITLTVGENPVIDLTYSSGVAVQIADVVDVDAGNGPRMRVVVIIPSQEAAPGFDAAEWTYLEYGVVLQDKTLLGLLHLEEFGDEHVLVQRA